jgi:tripartite-type tricarboxylate transporter receptor subunit TctC
MTNLLAHRSISVAVLTVLMAVCTGATAQDKPAQSAAWPNKPVKFINTFPPGGPSDILARAVGDALQKQFNQAFVVENKPGASGSLGADLVAKAPADGHTLLWGIDTTFTVNPHIYKNLAYKNADLKPLVVIASSGLLVGVHPATGYKSMQDLVAAGKSKMLNFSSGGSGSPGHLAVEVFSDAAGIKLTHIPYKGNSPAVLAIVAGEVDGGVLATTGMLPQVKAGKITPLAVTSRKRSTLAPDLPTVAEAGVKELENEVVYVVMVSSATPESVTQAMQKSVIDALQQSDMRKRIASLDMDYEGLTGSFAAKRLSDLYTRYGKVIAATGMKVE